MHSNQCDVVHRWYFVGAYVLGTVSTFDAGPPLAAEYALATPKHADAVKRNDVITELADLSDLG